MVDTTHRDIMNMGGRKEETITKRRHARGWPPKGSYPHPASGHIHQGPKKPGQRIRVTAHLKAEPDTKKLALAVIELAKYLDKEKRNKIQS